LSSRIRARLSEEKFSSLPNISIQSDAKGAVVMSGRISSEQEADRMLFIVHRIQGVTAVKSFFSMAGEK
jgi:osmotically-inducible protein OsmY